MSAFSAASAADTIHCQLSPPLPTPTVSPQQGTRLFASFSAHGSVWANWEKEHYWARWTRRRGEKPLCYLTRALKGGWRPKKEDQSHATGAYFHSTRKNRMQSQQTPFWKYIYITHLNENFIWESLYIGFVQSHTKCNVHCICVIKWIRSCGIQLKKITHVLQQKVRKWIYMYVYIYVIHNLEYVILCNNTM